jgi:succinate dehydrogenase/fumarate reductase flavoprotein subunit
MEEIRTDVLIAGGGMAGLMAAWRAQRAGAGVVLLTGAAGASVQMAGFSTALGEAPDDRPADLFNDMFLAGGFLNHPALLAAIVARIGPETRALEELGVPFLRANGKLARRQAAGVSRPRAVVSRDMVGMTAGKLLLGELRAAGARARILEGGFLLGLEVEEGALAGGLVHLRKSGDWVRVAAPAVVLATGGAGQLFRATTNFPGIQGIGYALALEAGAALVDMEFVSYEPTVALGPGPIAGMELPTMAFADGARLLNGRGEEFLGTSPPPSKDVMSRAMLCEVAEGRGTPQGGVYFDLTTMRPETAQSYSQIRRVLAALRLSPDAARIEVMPRQHFLMGGVAVDESGAAEVPGLYAAGEVSGGAHGAHRLATCGGTEAIALGAIAGTHAAEYARGARRALGGPLRPRPELLSSADADDRARLVRIQAALEDGCGPLRDAAALDASRSALEGLRDELQGEAGGRTFLSRAVLVALSIASAAAARTESRGDHFRTDHPERDDRRWLGNLHVRLGRGPDLRLSYHRAGISTREAMPLPGQAQGSCEGIH